MMTMVFNRATFAKPPRVSVGCGSTNVIAMHEASTETAEHASSHAGGHPEGSATQEQAASRPRNLFERRGRGGIAPVKMDVIKPFKARQEGCELAILSAPATHIRLGAADSGDGRFFTCIDIHTYEFFLMKEKAVSSGPLADIASPSASHELLRNDNIQLGNPAGAAADQPAAVDSSSKEIEAAGALAQLAQGGAEGRLCPFEHGETVWGRETSSDEDFTPDKKMVPHASSEVPLIEVSPVSSACISPAAADKELSEVWSAPPSALSGTPPSSSGCKTTNGTSFKRRRHACGADSSSSRSPDMLTPRNVDAATSLFAVPPRPVGADRHYVAPPRVSGHATRSLLLEGGASSKADSGKAEAVGSKRRRGLPPSL